MGNQDNIAGRQVIAGQVQQGRNADHALNEQKHKDSLEQRDKDRDERRVAQTAPEANGRKRKREDALSSLVVAEMNKRGRIDEGWLRAATEALNEIYGHPPPAQVQNPPQPPM